MKRGPCPRCGARVELGAGSGRPFKTHYSSKECRQGARRRGRKLALSLPRVIQKPRVETLRVNVSVQWAGAGGRPGSHGLAWYRLPAGAESELYRRIGLALEQLGGKRVCRPLRAKGWVLADDYYRRRFGHRVGDGLAGAAPMTGAKQLTLELAARPVVLTQPARGRDDTRACSTRSRPSTTRATASRGTPTSPSSGRTAAGSAQASSIGAGAACSSSPSRRGKLEPMGQRGKKRMTAETLDKVRAAAQTKRASIGLDPIPPENLEHEAVAERKARKRKR